MFISKTLDRLNELESAVSELHDQLPPTFISAFVFFKEDVMLTFQSILEKDSVITPQLLKATEKFANNYYGVKAFYFAEELYKVALQHAHTHLYEAMVLLKVQIQSQISFSLNHQDEVKNPFPRQLFFSQKFHNPKFSLKSQRAGVSGETLDEMVEKLRTNQISADYLRVNIYFAHFQNEWRPFVYNNRTWVVFSKAQQDASRFVPLLPTQDMLNRIKALEDTNPVVIHDETQPAKLTVSFKK